MRLPRWVWLPNRRGQLVSDPYEGREQSETKHFILRHYLYALAYKVLSGSGSWRALTFVDGFSGPWSTQTEDFSDTSFMIALDALAKVERDLRGRGRPVEIRCFFSEKKKSSFEKLVEVTDQFQKENPNIKIMVRNAPFLELIDEAANFSQNSFRLTFIDPTGWSGYSLPDLRPLMRERQSEILINYMHDFINRAVAMKDPKTVRSLEPILGKKWRENLPIGMNPGEACEELFRKNLKHEGKFEYVLSTQIDRVSAERPLFFLAYGTHSFHGVRTFRDIEHTALRNYGQKRANKRARKENEPSLFSEAELPAANPFYEKLDKALEDAKEHLLEVVLAKRPRLKFLQVCEDLMVRFPVKQTQVKDICVELASEGIVEDTWSVVGRRKPSDYDIVRLR